VLYNDLNISDAASYLHVTEF